MYESNGKFSVSIPRVYAEIDTLINYSAVKPVF